MIIKTAKNNFRILQLTDIHYEKGYPNAPKTLSLLNKVLDKSKPDLVVITGDLCSTFPKYEDYKTLAELFYSRDILWAPVLGNHDGEKLGDEGRKKVMEYMITLPKCLAKLQVEGVFGYGNYIIDINMADKFYYSLVMLDSGCYITDEDKLKYNVPKDNPYAFVDKSQIEWYQREITTRIKDDNTHTSLLFMHIPPVEFNQAYVDGIVEYGVKREKVCCPYHNNNFFDTIAKLKDTKAIFVGHDHINDYCAAYRGVKLVYGQSSGYQTYGLKPLKKMLSGDIRGGTEIVLSRDANQFVIKPIKIKDLE